MKLVWRLNLASALAVLALFSTLNSPLSTCFAQGTAFTYQGQLWNNGTPASGTYNLKFTLFNAGVGGAVVAGPVTNNTVSVTNGLFTVMIDFGSSPWNGETNWLQIGVETNHAAAFNTLSPLQELTPTPYAIQAESLSALAVQNNTNGAPNLIGGSTLNYVPPGVIGATIGGGGGISNDYSNSVTANYGTVGGGANNTATGGAVVAGGFGNTASSGWAEVGGGYGNNATAEGSAVGGGFYNQASAYVAMVGGGIFNSATAGGAFVGGGGYDGVNYEGNQAAGNASFIGGGLDNSISAGSTYSAVVSGQANAVQGNSYNSVVVGGEVNTIGADFNYSFIGGGLANGMVLASGGTADTISGGQGNGMTGMFISDSVISGGTENQTLDSADTIGGGSNNLIQSGAPYSVIAGGESNIVSGPGSFIGGGGYEATFGTFGGNVVAGSASVIVGGVYNQAPGSECFIGGGHYHTASGYAATIAGGEGNNALQNDTFIGGGYGNTAQNYDSAICGGDNNGTMGYAAIVGGGEYNNANSDHDTIGGGYYNLTTNSYSTVEGGDGNNAQGEYDTIGGGDENLATNEYSTVGGGGDNIASGTAATVGGGGGLGLPPLDILPLYIPELGNKALGDYSTVSGGAANTASGYAATVPGGDGNLAAGDYSFAAGRNAQATNNETFVWSDGSVNPFTSTTNNQFLICASGDVGINTNAPGYTLDVCGSINASGIIYAGGVALTSDRNVKENFTSLNPRAVLDKVAALPVTEWNYKADKSAEHIGPMAQDFQAAFGLNGKDDKHISVIDEGGVALAAIQGLNQKLENESREQATQIQSQSSEISELKQQNDLLAQRLNELEQTVKTLTDKN